LTGPDPRAATWQPFRFLVSLPVIGPDVAGWRRQLERIEDLGYHAVSVSDHVIGGWSMDVLIAMTAAAMATTRLRIRSLVVANDYRHPVFVHRSIASMDVLSGGRIELGLGTGWWPAEYAALGLALDPPAVRVARLAEALDIIEGLFAGGPVDHEGAAYRMHGVEGRPQPVQRPRPPILVGGGSRGILELAARRADIVGVLPTRGADARVPVELLTPEANARRVAIVREAAAAAGRDPGGIPIQLSILASEVVGPDGTRRRTVSSLVPEAVVDTSRDRELPGVVAGDVDEACAMLREWRDRYGYSDVHVGADAEAFGPVVERLAGR
jgi:probable F420-dependent oxidoreductase